MSLRMENVSNSINNTTNSCRMFFYDVTTNTCNGFYYDENRYTCKTFSMLWLRRGYIKILLQIVERSLLWCDYA